MKIKEREILCKDFQVIIRLTKSIDFANSKADKTIRNFILRIFIFQNLCERSFRTRQGKLPQEMRIRHLTAIEAANHFLNKEHIQEFNRRFTIPAQIQGTAFVPCQITDLKRLFPIESERVVNQDNKVE